MKVCSFFSSFGYPAFIALLLYGRSFAYTSEALNDEVTYLPRATSELQSRQFSGFLQISPTKFVHYYYFESEDDPVEDSIIFWTNGGPGCTGLLGLFTEMGPWRPQPNGSLARNPFTWTQKASMVFIEQPAGVGFSFTTDNTLLSSYNDYHASTDNLQVLKAFFQRFPERSSNDLYLSSESYGGHYIPQWTLQVFNDPDSESLRSRFKGFILGNPYTNYGALSIALANILWGLQLVPQAAWNLVTESTCDLLSHDAYFFAMHLPQCLDYLGTLIDYSVLLNPYALGYNVCPADFVPQSANKHRGGVSVSTHASSQQRILHRKVRQYTDSIRAQQPLPLEDHAHAMHQALGGQQIEARIQQLQQRSQITRQQRKLAALAAAVSSNYTSSSTYDTRAPFYDPCIEFYTEAYLNDPVVQEALHVGISSLRGYYGQADQEWGKCNDRINERWSSSDFLADSTHLYSQIYNHPNKPTNFKMLVFSGDSDGVCATVGTQHWIYNIQGASIKSLWQPWTYSDSYYGIQQGGFRTIFTNSLAFVTVHFAGHEVPGYQPEKALQMLSDYLDNSMYATESSSDTGSTHPSATGFLIALLAILLVIFVGVVVVSVAQFRKPQQRSTVDGSNNEDDGL